SRRIVGTRTRTDRGGTVARTRRARPSYHAARAAVLRVERVPSKRLRTMDARDAARRDVRGVRAAESPAQLVRRRRTDRLHVVVGTQPALRQQPARPRASGDGGARGPLL